MDAMVDAVLSRGGRPTGLIATRGNFVASDQELVAHHGYGIATSTLSLLMNATIKASR
jgi:hypothetical protein